MSVRDSGFMKSFVRRVHFVGIGGVGMSGIAEVLNNLGYDVSGSDMKETEITRRLRAAGVRVFLDHKARHAAGAQAVVTSSAVAPDNPEVAWAKAKGVPVIPRALMLAEIGRMKKTLTVAGSHGKTTTTSMASMALRAAGADPTMIIGGQLKNIRSNARLGVGEYLVAEADESDGSFVHLTPLVAVVTNVDNDHLDHHKTMDGLKAAFVAHLQRLPFYGAAVLCADDKALMSLRDRIDRPVITYGFSPKAQWRGRILSMGKEGTRMDVLHNGRRALTLQLRVSGRHNALNALGALAAGRFLGFDLQRLAKGLADFRGVGRRLDRLGIAAGIEFIDDYGHHPTEIVATLAALRLWKPKRLVVIFQPHRYSRTKLLASEFGAAFGDADFVFVAPVYAAGEKPIKGVSSELILAALRKSGVACAPLERPLDAAKEIRRGDLVLTLGAGDVWKTGEDLLRRVRADLTSPV